MKKFLFVLLTVALALPMVAQEKTYVAGAFKTKSTVAMKQAMQPNLPMKLKAVNRADVPEGEVVVTLVAGDIWGDQSGYQMLLDADATAYGSYIPETGALPDASGYSLFEYKIPENADGDLNTSNIVINNSVSITIPAGVYDYCIVNPTPGDRLWIASSQGPVPGRYDDFVFDGGYEYIFTIGIYGSNDGVSLEIPIEGQALTTPEGLTADPTATTAAIAWEDNDDMGWTLRYRPYVDPALMNKFWDFPLEGYQDQIDEGFLVYDLDGDGYGWGLAYSDDSQTDVCFYSSSYENYEGLTPDNWLFTPAVGMGGTLKFKTWNQSSYFPDKIAVYVCTNPEWETVDEFVEVMANIEPGTNPEEIEIDLSGFEGMGVIAFRHFDCEDQWTIYLDDIQVIIPGAVDPAEWVVVEGLDATNYNIEGLTPETEYEVQVQAVGVNGVSAWTPSVIFTTLAEGGEEPTDQCAKPEGGFENGVDFHGVMVTLINNETAEGTELHYNITKDGELIIEDAIYDEAFALTEDGEYYIDFWATAPGMLDSSHGGLIFTIDAFTGLSELLEGKTVAAVRYFNVAGQEIAQPEGLTIVVTTYTDGTTNAAKVVK